MGVGYNFELYHQRQAVFNNATNNPFNLPQIYQHNLYPNLGIHYYYNQHQMELSYRYIGTIASPKLASANGVNFKTKVDYTSFFNFAYSFRF